MKRWIAAFLALALSGCLSSGSREAPRYFVLDVPSSGPQQAKVARAATLLVAATSASAFYDSADIAYSRAPGTRGHYQYASWTEAPAARITGLLAARLERSGAFRNVIASSSGVKGGLLLSTQLEELYHDASSSPGGARVVFNAVLTDPAQRAFVARRTFSASAPAPSFDAPGAAQAMGRAVAAVLDDVTEWVDRTAPP